MAEARARAGVTRLGSIEAAGRTAAFVLKVLPMLPSGAVDWVTPTPVVEKVRYPATAGDAVGDLYRPSTPGSHPAMLVCLGVVPFETDHPQVPILGRALARAGFAALMYWSSAMRDLRLDPGDAEDIALAYDWLVRRSDIDARGSGMLGTCVGGSFALMAAAHPLVRERVGFVAEWAAYSSMWTFARDIASATRPVDGRRVSWSVDALTRKVFVRSLTAVLEPAEAALLRQAMAERTGQVDATRLSADARAIYPLLTDLDADDAGRALADLPVALRDRLDALSPMASLTEICAPLIVLAHDRDDGVIPIAESRQLAAALGGRPGVHFTEFEMFEHLDPLKKRVSPIVMVRELARLYRSLYPVFRLSTRA